MTPAKPPLLTLDCPRCDETYWARAAHRRDGTPHTCDDCGGRLYVRPAGTEPWSAAAGRVPVCEGQKAEG